MEKLAGVLCRHRRLRIGAVILFEGTNVRRNNEIK